MIPRFALIIGAMKCGTTSLFRHLSEHPQVCPCRVKEPNFFADDENWKKGLAWYESLWDWDPARHTIALEASTFYTKMPARPNAAERIAQLDADFRFIYVLRNPLDRIESQYAHGELHEVALTPLRNGVDPHAIDLSRYAAQIAEYYKRFPAASILLLHFEKLRDQPHDVLKTVCQFLDIDTGACFPNANRVFNKSAKKHVDGPLYTLLTRVPGLPAVARLIPVQQRERLRRKLGRSAARHASLSDAQRAHVKAQLADDLARLRDEYGFDTSSWRL